MVNRSGTIEYVIVGEPERIVIPPLKRFRTGFTRLRGLRYIHTHLRGEPLSRDDLVDLALLRLDLIAAFEVDGSGLPGKVYVAHLLPQNPKEEVWSIFEPMISSELNIDFSALIQSLEEEFRRSAGARRLGDKRERAILVSVNADGKKYQALDSLQELKELAESGGLVVLDAILQTRSEINPKYVLGKGKINDLIIRALQLDADLIIFDQELTPAQARSISEITELKVIDRTQLILDIFAQRAQSRDGKIQVELAQLRYLLPRLRSKDDAFSRLTGGIGARGPGETKIEIDRRRVKEKITRLEKQIALLSLGRNTRRTQRRRNDLPIISIIGYTNAGKSSLLNSLTHSHVFVENKLFATLDPASRRLRFPREREVIVTDTVGFIKDLPRDLLNAFRATLDELQEADLLLHVIDISNPHFEDQMRAVEKLIGDLELSNIPTLKVLNKKDKVPAGQVYNLCHMYDAVAISALHPFTLTALIEKIEEVMWGELTPIGNTNSGGDMDEK